MRLVHFADPHLGFRQYQRLTAAGMNQREADVNASFTRVIDTTIALAPDVVLVAGDVFHQVRPANPAILHGFSEMARLVTSLPDAIVIAIAGNHETPRSRDTTCILRLFTELGVHVVDSEVRRLDFPDRNLAVLCVPDVPRIESELLPEPTARYNILMAHGEPRGMFPLHEAGERASLVLEPEDLARDEWDYVALGHYHVHRKAAPRGWYSGSVDYTSSNPWGEMRDERAAGISGKGLIEYDLAKGKHTFHSIPVSRAYVDLPAIEGRGLGAAELDARIDAAVAGCAGGIDDKIIRLILRNVPRHVARDLNHKVLREHRKRALHFHVDVRPPQVNREEASGAPGRATTLAATLRARLTARPLDSELNRERFVSLGLEYLARADAARASHLEEPS
ncbi:MAG TPA: metallophosphoesterase [Gemmatimonadaceae bacterium]|nr:metallophosphoesterase [Gemmatimonadaceae bacterium]